MVTQMREVSKHVGKPLAAILADAGTKILVFTWSPLGGLFDSV